MAFPWAENLHSTAFTPRDFQVELLAAADEENIITCLGHKSSKQFIALKLILERSHELRQSIPHRKITIYISNDASSGESAYNLIWHLTDLQVVDLNAISRNDIDWESLPNKHQVWIASIDLLLDALLCSYIDTNTINLIVIEEYHKIYGSDEMKELVRHLEESKQRPKILALAGPLHSAGCLPSHLDFHLNYMEKVIDCRTETASDIVTVLRYCTKPIEVVLQCAPPKENELTMFLRDLVSSKRSFFIDHRFDPSEMYSDDLLEEMKKVPDPKKEPLEFLDQFLEVLDEFGPWTADRAALNLLTQIEKAKVRTPYERHFLLLGLVSTTFIQIRAHCDYVFQKLPTEKERIETYSSPKVLRVLEVLRLFAPDKKFKSDNAQSEFAQTKVNELNSLDFKKVSNGINSLCTKLDNIHISEITSIKQGLNCLVQTRPEASISSNAMSTGPQQMFRSFRNRKTPMQRLPRSNYNHTQHDPDALCGIVFCNSSNTARVLFSLFYEMSKNDPQLNYLSVQFTLDRTADPITETKQAEIEHRKQEEVLKRFRMHNCNLLIGTAVLEEGIELPKCNLVIRWDPPTTYRSYVQCKGRARAHHAYHIIVVAPSNRIEMNMSPNALPDRSHQITCAPDEHFSEKVSKILSEMYPEIEHHTFHSSMLKPEQADDNSIKEESTKNESVQHNGIHENGVNTGETEVRDLLKVKDIDVEDDSDDGELQTTESEEKHYNILEMIENHSCVVNKESVRKEIEKLFAMNDQDIQLEAMNNDTKEIIHRLSQYREMEKMLLSKCNNKEPPDYEIVAADLYTSCLKPYQPLTNELEGASVNLSTAILLVNKYCAKLPSDTFTKLTPLWRCARTERNGVNYYQYTIRLPINSPLKQDILGLPMPSRTVARRMAALIACKLLHQSGELDDSLQPIGKEGFRASEPEWENFELEQADAEIVNDNSEPRPGTTRRRQYYYKKIASAFCDCRPTVGSKCYLYHIKMTLECPIPEEQNTRGRKVYPPEEATQGFGILTLKRIPKLSAFSIFTRSGEVRVALELAKTDIIITEVQLAQINVFLKYTFTNVLRLQKYLMLFDADAKDNSFYIVPTVRDENGVNDVDWSFLDVIESNCNVVPTHVPDEIRACEDFDANRFRDAVVMPWYRNQDQPQYFYVAEICDYLSPESSFPGDNYKTFQEYYFRKYSIAIQNKAQPLLDVDHTSARLNFLTPRYVNRKGVALPTSSEETKRAKRENLEQKQILVPELCTIHPFPASLWRAAVCLPCVLYRFNALLLADEIRKKVAHDIGLGMDNIDQSDIEWSVLDFGWSLADVLKRAKENAKLNESKPKNETDDTQLNISKPPNDVQNKEDERSSNKAEESKDELDSTDAKTANDILDEADRKLKESQMEIGTWSNQMAENIDMNDSMSDEDWGILPPNVNICSRDKTLVRYGSPTSWNIGSNRSAANNYFSDSDDSYQSDDDSHPIGNDVNDKGCLKIEFKSDNVAEAIESEEDIKKRQRHLEIINDINANEKDYHLTKNDVSGYDCMVDANNTNAMHEMNRSEHVYLESVESFRKGIVSCGTLVKYNEPVTIEKHKTTTLIPKAEANFDTLAQLVSFLPQSELLDFLGKRGYNLEGSNVQVSLNDFAELHANYLKGMNGIEKYVIEGSGSVFDQFNDANNIQRENNKLVLTLKSENLFRVRILKRQKITDSTDICDAVLLSDFIKNDDFSFDRQPNLVNHPGPSPSVILQALTMSNANDGVNLERLETIGDSFLKYAITTYLYCTYENVHEGKLSHLRSRQVSNLNLYRLGRRKILGDSMIATKFEPHDNWLPPCYYVPKDLEKALIEANIPTCHWDIASIPNVKEMSINEICRLLKEKAFGFEEEDECSEEDDSFETDDDTDVEEANRPINMQHNALNSTQDSSNAYIDDSDAFACFIPYNLVTQHSIPDKSIADCVEALIGAYLIDCGPRGALLFMAWLGIRVLPSEEVPYDEACSKNQRITGSTQAYERDGKMYQTIYGYWAKPKSPLLFYAPNPYNALEQLLDGYSEFEAHIGYTFRDRSYLLQAMTHASYSPNRLTDCYQRLEFLGDAVLDYLITRHLYEDPRQHSPGALTDLRSALVNNTIFASLAVRHGFHKYFRHLSPGLNDVIDRFVRIQHENGHSISEEFYLISEEECDEAEDVEVPKALGDLFESVAGAIFLDSSMSLDVVWKVYSGMMKPEIEQFSNSVPKSPIRELLELEPETAKFSKPEKLADGRRVRVTVEVFGKGTYRGIGRNYRIAKCTAAKCALRQLKKQGLINKKH